jgi:hypothetical protein
VGVSNVPSDWHPMDHQISALNKYIGETSMQQLDGKLFEVKPEHKRIPLRRSFKDLVRSPQIEKNSRSGFRFVNLFGKALIRR